MNTTQQLALGEILLGVAFGLLVAYLIWDYLGSRSFVRWAMQQTWQDGYHAGLQDPLANPANAAFERGYRAGREDGKRARLRQDVAVGPDASVTTPYSAPEAPTVHRLPTGGQHWGFGLTADCPRCQEDARQRTASGGVTSAPATADKAQS